MVPGAWLGAWAWQAVTPLLERAGNEAYPLTLTGMGDRVHLASPLVGIGTAVQDVINAIEYEELEDVVLVGHSFAGKVVAAVADRVPEKIRLVLYLDSFWPQKVNTPQGGFDPAEEFGPQPPGAFTIPLTDATVDRIGKDVRGAKRSWMMSMATPWPINLAKDSITLSKNYDKVKEAFIFCSQSGDPVDEIIAGKWGKLRGPHRVVDSGHWPMITKPAELARAMIELA